LPTHRKITLLLASTFLLPAVAFADAGVPMLFVVMPVFGFSLVPIVLIEALYLQKSLALTFGHAIRGSLLANAVSTLVGIPLTWIGLVVLEATTGGGRAYGLGSLLGRVGAVTWQAPWLIPYESNLHWMIPVAGTVLLVPFFFVSWWIEYLICVTRFTSVSPVAVRRAVRDANLITYGLLLFWPAAFYLMTPA
jgi:hypothetical protein